jgi:superfamily II DNA/RNA helicase
MPAEIKKLTAKFLSNPREVSVSPPATTATTVEQFVVRTSSRLKAQTLVKLVSGEKVQSALIFCNRKRDIDGVCKSLIRAGFPASPMHGDMAQKNRTDTLQDFKDGKINLLVCSDVAARGIDIDDLSHVFNFDVPRNADDYVHRIGRTGRAGKTGRSFTLVSGEEDEKFLAAVEALIKKSLTPVADSLSRTSGEQAKPAPVANPRPSSRPVPSRPVSLKPEAPVNLPKTQPPKILAKPVREADMLHETHIGFGHDMPDFFRKRDS